MANGFPVSPTNVKASVSGQSANPLVFRVEDLADGADERPIAPGPPDFDEYEADEYEHDGDDDD